MSSESDGRRDLLERLGNAIRANQRATDVVDDAIVELLGINRTDARCLDILDQHGRMTAGELAKSSHLTTGAITAVVDRLERAGYARRVPDPADRRRVLIEPTQEAYQASADLMAPMLEDAERVMPAYSDEQLELIIAFTEQGTAIQERHAETLRRWLAERRGGAA